MARLLLFRTVAKLLGPIGIGATAFYFGTQNAHVVEKAEHNLLRSHMEYAEDSHRGGLGIEEVENNNGELEKTLKNLDTGDTIYSIKTDCLPDNNFIYNGLAGRLESSNPRELREMREYTKGLETMIEDRLYKGAPVSKESVNPLKLRVHVRENIDGELEAALSYGDRSVPLTKQDFDYLAKNAKQLSAQVGLNPNDVQISSTAVQGTIKDTPTIISEDNPGSGSGGTSYLTYGVLGALAVALSAAGNRIRKNYQFAD